MVGWAVILTMTLEKSDNIIVLDNGAISEQGTHNELLKNKKFYSQIHVNQANK